jgi:hypothetical protein
MISAIVELQGRNWELIIRRRRSQQKFYAN